jgi:asparagine synthase (glutamine-hydrolysing)
MSVQFGRWNFDGRPSSPEYIERTVSTLVPYGPDCQNSYSKGGLTIVYRAFHTTKESRGEAQPHRSRSGAVITWDGRLDNRTELKQQLRPTLESGCPDVLIVAAAYEKWGTQCFAKLIGDWALSIWNPDEQSLIFAKDPVGSRHLYYSLDHTQVTWSSLLEPLVLCADQSFKLNEEYIAGWLSFSPAPQLTPYAGIHAVPPSSFVSVVRGTKKVTKYWDFDPYKRILYQTDNEYEEHFRSVFGEAIRRRLRSDTPVLAELSGGLDSSSIVCTADIVIGRGKAETPRLDTISYYDDSEPNWNERPYFTKVEEGRGRAGCHIDVSSRDIMILRREGLRFVTAPGADTEPTEATRRFAACMLAQGNRVLLSGFGGDEVMGGVPTPIPELEDLLARARFTQLARQLKIWALNKRKPWFHLLLDAVRGFCPSAVVGIRENNRPAPWFTPNFVRRNRDALQGYGSRLKLFGSLPSFQENLRTLDFLRRQLSCDAPPSAPFYEKRYPFLDRELLEFTYAIPREQLVRPGQRRSLMRRALAGIVPDELLNRKRKAFVARAPRVALCRNRALLQEMQDDLVSSAIELIDRKIFCGTLEKVWNGQEVPIVTLMRTIAIEVWLKDLVRSGLLCLNGQGNKYRASFFGKDSPAAFRSSLS